MSNGKPNVKKAQARISPLKSRSRRHAGQSLDERIDHLVYEGMLKYVFLGVIFIVITTIEWIRWYSDVPPYPITFTVITLVVVMWCASMIWITVREVKPLKLAREGERLVGEYLELFREDGARVFHDLVGDSFNVDHVLIAEQGVYVIETKTYSKPHDGRVVFDGAKLLVDGFDKSDKLLVQAKAEAGWVRRLIEESTGRQVKVKTVIVFPGWFVESSGDPADDTLVMNPRMLRRFLKERPKDLSIEDMKLISYHLSRFIRMTPVAV